MDLQELFDKVHFELLLKYNPEDIKGNEKILESTIELTKQVLILHIFTKQRELLIDFADLVMINDCDLHTKKERALAVDKYLKGYL